MTTNLASLMSVPIKQMPPIVPGAMAPSSEYGLLMNRFELARYNGCINDLPVLIAYRGRIYDVTGREPWSGEPSWRRYAGKDCTDDLRTHPHRKALLTSLPCVGALED